MNENSRFIFTLSVAILSPLITAAVGWFAFVDNLLTEDELRIASPATQNAHELRIRELETSISELRGELRNELDVANREIQSELDDINKTQVLILTQISAINAIIGRPAPPLNSANSITNGSSP